MGNPGYLKVSAGAQARERSICGFRQRLLKKEDCAPASITRLRTEDATPHWHRYTHEYYYVLHGSGRIFVDGEAIDVTDGDCVWIKPGHMHCAEGDLESLIIGVPPFDPDDTFLEPPERANV